MITWALRRAIDKVEWELNDDDSYRRDMIDASPRADGWSHESPTCLPPPPSLGESGLPHRRPHKCRTSRPPSAFTP